MKFKQSESELCEEEERLVQEEDRANAQLREKESQLTSLQVELNEARSQTKREAMEERIRAEREADARLEAKEEEHHQAIL